eukprot:451283-Amphidinium_carterae.1
MRDHRQGIIVERDQARDELFEVQEKIRALPTEPVPGRVRPWPECSSIIKNHCSKRYERVSLELLELAAREASFPSTILRAALDIYRGHHRVLVNGAVSSPYQARSGLRQRCRLPVGCALAVDLLDAFNCSPGC